MMVSVQLFARARDLAGTATVRVELGDQATVAELKRRLGESHPALAPLLERSAIAVALRDSDGSRERAAELLGISATTLWRKMTRLGIVFEHRG